MSDLPKNEKWTCEGDWSSQAKDSSGTPMAIASRRSVLLAGALALTGWLGRSSALADVTLGDPNREKDILVVLFLRGGADGLNILVPYGDDGYYRNRPGLGLAKPKDGRTVARARARDLNGFFGLHPSLEALLPTWEAGTLAPIHAVGSQDHTRSHFEAMSAMERGAAHEGAGPSSGWLARHLISTEQTTDSPLRAIAFGDTMPDSLRGASNSLTLNSIQEFRLDAPDAFKKKLSKLYASGKDVVQDAGYRTLEALDSLKRIDPSNYKPSNGAVYPTSDLGNAFREVACLVRSGVGLEAACLDKGGWDTHVAQGADIGWQALLLEDTALSLAAFAKDLGSELKRVTVVVMTEFGRRVEENSGLGTDHGRASCAFVLGGNVVGGKVHGQWPGLAAKDLDPIGDLRVTTDYRDLLSEVLQKRMGNPHVAEVFPEYTTRPVGIIRA